MGFGEPDTLRNAGDQHSHEFLAAELERLRPEDVVLSEEGADDRTRLDADRVWIVDPLDGTREYGEQGRTDWAVHVALWERAALSNGLGGGATRAAAGSGGGGSRSVVGRVAAAADDLAARRLLPGPPPDGRAGPDRGQPFAQAAVGRSTGRGDRC